MATVSASRQSVNRRPNAAQAVAAFFSRAFQLRRQPFVVCDRLTAEQAQAGIEALQLRAVEYKRGLYAIIAGSPEVLDHAERCCASALVESR